MGICPTASTRFSKLSLRALTALGAVALLLFAAPQARAASCTETLKDSLGFDWDVTSGALGDGWSGESAGGFVAAGGNSTYPDAYDAWGALEVDRPGLLTPGPEYYLPADLMACDREAGGREIVLPPKTIEGLQVRRKIYVPASGPGFARFLDFVTNNTGGVTAVTLSYEGDLGSDDATRVRETSDGNSAVLAPPDRWATSDAGPSVCNPSPPAQSDPALAHVWDGPNAPAPAPTTGVLGGDSGTTPWTNCEARVRVEYSFTMGAGETHVFMHFEAQRSTAAGALTVAQDLGDAKASGGDGFAFMDESTELAKLKNWNPNDLDGDSVAAGDNCRFTYNPAQANLDGDGFGDACDDDIDGDGLSNATEALLGTNPNAPDSDGDGRNDGADGCPRTAGFGPNGCPASAAAPPSSVVRDTTSPRLTVRAPRSIKRKRFLKGISALATINEPASLEFKLLGSTSRAQRRTFSLVLSRQLLPTTGSGTRAARLRPSRRRIGKARRLTVRLQVTATDRSGNKTVQSLAIRVR
jgi:hypothetical protein